MHFIVVNGKLGIYNVFDITKPSVNTDKSKSEFGNWENGTFGIHSFFLITVMIYKYNESRVHHAWFRLSVENEILISHHFISK